MSQLEYYLRRTAVTIGLVFAAATALFFFFRAMPGSAVDIIAVSSASPEQLEALRAEWGLDQPIYIQYYQYLANLLTGNMGESFRYGRPVTEITLTRIRNSFILVGPAIITAYLLGSVFGGIMGQSSDSLTEKYGTISMAVVGTIPDFFLGLLLVLVFAQYLNFFPTSGMLSISTQASLGSEPSLLQMMLTTDFWLHYTLPFLTIVFKYLYYPALVMRTSVVEVSDQNFVYLNRIKGLPRRRRLRRLMKHASLPVITIFPLSMSKAIGGLILVEIVFNWPGIGSLLVEAVQFRDYPVVQFVFFLIAVWVIVGNYVVDILYSAIDPRVTIEEGTA
jgi:peptide/nickel transport system permease protein